MAPLTVLQRWRLSSLALSLALLLAACDTVAIPGSPRTPASSTAQAPTAGPQPTPLPAATLLARALHARQIGDYDAAALELRATLDAHPHAPEARPAAFYLAESFALRGRWTSAVEALRGFVAGGPSDELHARALFLLARGQEEAGAWADAVATYERYRALKTPLAAYAQLREAAQLRALGRLDQAAEGYEAAAASDIVRGERAGAYEKAIALRRQLGQSERAIELYHKLLDHAADSEPALAELPDYRARILAEAAALATEIGAGDQARAWLRELAEQAPESPQALAAVGQLMADPQSGLDPAVAAHVYHLHEQWAAALAQYDLAMGAASGEYALELRRQRALARRANNDMAGALAELAAIAAESPGSEPGRQAQLDWVQSRGQSGDTQAAIDGYRQFAQAYPDDPRAPEALSRAAILLDRQGDSAGALQQQLDLGRRYPASQQAHDALYLAGWALFRAGRRDEARAAWDMLRRSASGVVAAQAAFWAARTVDPDGDEYNALLKAAAAAAPDSYYGARAIELLDQARAGTTPLGAPIADADWRAAEDWIATWSGAPAHHIAEHGYPPDVAQAEPVLRGIALEQVGLHSEAIAEWNEARARWRADPLKLYFLARLAHEHGVPYIALKAAEDLVGRAPDAARANTPEALRRLIFPTPYSEVMVAQAREHGLDPRALYAMLRQESLFDPGATSWAGARGLAQVMPSTAQGIAQQLKLPSFAEGDLYRPMVSIRFGAFYLDRQLDLMQDSLPGALAAYNGGPGNAQRWAGGTTVADPDMFIEGIDYDETRGYVKLVYGYYGAYQRLYQLP